MLIVLDNFEHLQTGAPLISEILAAAPGVKIIATSRERLYLKVEWLLEVGGMQVPLSDASNLESFEAVQLYLETARRVSPGFSLTAENSPYVVHICQLLAGMPLGIELAASWSRAMSSEEIAREVSESLDFLATQLRDTPERHRSMRAVFDHSWKLLSEYEKNSLKKNRGVPRRFFERRIESGGRRAALHPVASGGQISVAKKGTGRYEKPPGVDLIVSKPVTLASLRNALACLCSR